MGFTLPRARAFAVALLPALALAGLWEGFVRAASVDPVFLPAPSRILRAAVESAGLLAANARQSLLETVLGLALAFVAGCVLGVLIDLSPLLRRMIYPLLVVSQTIPMIALAPLLVLWFGYGITPKVVVVALIVFFPVVVSTVAGLTGVDPEMIDLVRSMGASRSQVLRTVRLPAAVPAFFAGLRISAAYAVAGAVIGEWVGAEKGLGVFIDRSRASYAVDRIFVAVTVIALLSLALFAAVHLAARLASPWQYVGTEPQGQRR